MNTFYIKQGATQPVLVMRLNKNNQFQYEKFQKALENSSITFSMINTETNIYKITKKVGGLILKENCIDCLIPDNEYYIYYQFTEKDTNQPGIYKAEFKIDFYDIEPTDSTGIFIAPITDDLYVNIIPSLFTTFNRNNML